MIDTSTIAADVDTSRHAGGDAGCRMPDAGSHAIKLPPAWLATLGLVPGVIVPAGRSSGIDDVFVSRINRHVRSK